MRVLILTNPLYKWKKRPRGSRNKERSEQYRSHEYQDSGDLSFRTSCSHLRPIIWIAFRGVRVCWMPKSQLRPSSASMCVERGSQAWDALVAVSCKMLHLNGVISAKHVCQGAWDVILKHTPNPITLLKCSWNSRILMWSINPLLAQTLISVYK